MSHMPPLHKCTPRTYVTEEKALGRVFVRRRLHGRLSGEIGLGWACTLNGWPVLRSDPWPRAMDRRLDSEPRTTGI